MDALLDNDSHRQWPRPEGPWRWFQSWRHLLFAHYRVPADCLRPLIPSGLQLQEFDGAAWLGVVPFYLILRRRGLPAMPRLTCFPEINVRTYVDCDGKPGVWFFSLDARNRLAVWAAQRYFHLPYRHAAMRMNGSPQETRFESRRRRRHGGVAAFQARYGPVGDPAVASPGTLEYFLTERYCLYAEAPGGGLYRGDILHPPWPLHRGRAEITVNEMARPLGIDLPDEPPLLHYAKSIDVVLWSLERV